MEGVVMKKKLNVWRLSGCVLYMLFLGAVIRLAFVFPQDKSLMYTVAFCICIIGIAMIVFGLPGTYCFYRANRKKKKKRSKHSQEKRKEQKPSASFDDAM